MPSMLRGEPDASRQRRRLLARAERREAGKPRQRRDGVVDLRERPVGADVLHAPDELRLEVHRIQKSRAACASGRAFETTARAAIDSPVDSVTPDAAPSAASIRATSTPVRISTPACRAAAASASASAPGPPTTNQPLAIGCPSPAPSRSSSAALPADHGPRNEPSTPPAAIVARSGSLSNHSPTRSAAAIGIQRSSRYASGLPSARNFRPVFSSAISVGGARVVDATAAATPRPRAARRRSARSWSGSAGTARHRLRRERADLLRRARRVVPQDERAAIERRRADVDIGSDDAQPVPHQPEPPHDARIDRRRVRQRRTEKPRRDLARARASPDALGPLEDERLQPRFRQQRGGDEPLWPAPMTTTSCVRLNGGLSRRKKPQRHRATETS